MIPLVGMHKETDGDLTDEITTKFVVISRLTAIFL